MKTPSSTSPPRNATGLTDDRSEPARRALLMAGAVVFGEKGLAGATTRDIAARAGQNIAAIKYYFDGKEGLYLAIAGAIGAEIGMRLGPPSTLMPGGELPTTPRAAMDGLQQVVTAMTHTILNDELPAVAQFIVREQQNPTAAFDLIYDGGMRRVHETITALIETAFDLPPASTTAVLRAHAVMGQVLGFRVAHAALLRRTGWTIVGPKQTAAVADAIVAGLELMFAGRERATPASRPASKPTSKGASKPASKAARASSPKSTKGRSK